MYENEEKLTKAFVITAIIWGVIGMCMGLMAALQLYLPQLNFANEYINFGKIRPLHTNAIIFGLVCNFIIGLSLYIVAKTSVVNLVSKGLSWFLFWGWQITLVIGLISIALGYTSTKEYAEFEWPIDIAIVVLWLTFGYIFFGTLAKRKTKHIFVSNWFSGGVIIVIGLIYLINNLAIPVYAFKGYSIFSGASDALVQWWWGHNAVGFLLTAGFVGTNYYFIPKLVNRPIYSYRLSLITFWGLIGFYTWAGTHHLLFTSVPSWIQNIGVVMSILLWIPSWAGAFNAWMTCTSNKEELKTNPVVWFFLSSIAYYALATFEGPLMAIRWFNMIAHNTSWVIGHVHSGALGWVGMTCIATFYYFIPKLYKKELYSYGLVKVHFVLAHIGVLFYIVSLWIGGIGQGVKSLSLTESGSLTYSFVDILRFMEPYMLGRAIGGALFILGMLVMVYNLIMTVNKPQKVVVEGAY